MKKVLILLCAYLFTINCTGQKKDLLSFFDKIKNDSIVNTLDYGRMKVRKRDVSDAVAIYYFFGNNKENLYATGEAYNMDDNTYTEVRYKQTVTAVFLKSAGNNIQILSYWLDGINNLALYNTNKDSIISTYPFCILPDIGEDFTHSILFPNNYIFTVETTDKTRVKLIEIDTVNYRFIEHKNIVLTDYMFIEDVVAKNEKYQNALKLVGVSEKGELFEENE